MRITGYLCKGAVPSVVSKLALRSKFSPISPPSEDLKCEVQAVAASRLKSGGGKQEDGDLMVFRSLPPPPKPPSKAELAALEKGRARAAAYENKLRKNFFRSAWKTSPSSQ